jgi:uncharacterized membrane protein
MNAFLHGLHLMAAMVWIGGMLFLSLVAVPVLNPRVSGRGQVEIFRAMARRFRPIVWMAVVILLGTGPLLLSTRGLSLLESASWPGILSIKLGLVALLLLVTGMHDFLIGPRVVTLVPIPLQDRTALDRTLLLLAPWLARFSLLLAVAIVGAAVSLSQTP